MSTYSSAHALTTPPLPFPLIIGRDLVDTVVEVGEAIEDFVEGGRIWSNSLGLAGRQGAFAEDAAVATERLYFLPEDVDPAEPAPVLHSGGTAYVGLARQARLQPGETIVVDSASGAVGTGLWTASTTPSSSLSTLTWPRA